MGKRKIIFITGLLLLIITAGGAFYFFTQKSETSVAPVQNLFTSLFGKTESEEPANTNPATETTNGESQENNADISFERFYVPAKIAERIAGGVSFVENGSEKIRYVERDTGNVLEVSTNEPTQPRRLTNTTIPRIQNAIWSPDGTHVLLQYLRSDLSTIETYLAKIAPEESENDGEGVLEGVFLPPNSHTPSFIGENNERVLYFLKGASASQVVSVNLNGNSPTTLFSHPLTQITPQYTDTNELFILTNPSYSADGSLYLANKNTNTLRKILSGKTGFTAAVPLHGQEVFFSNWSDGMYLLSLYNRETETTKTTTLQTLPEKCVRDPNLISFAYCFVPTTRIPETYPDTWYQGVWTSRDNVWRVNLNTGDAELIRNLEEATGEEIDAIKPMIAAGGSTLLFINKRDLSLWSISLPTPEIINLGEEN